MDKKKENTWLWLTVVFACFVTTLMLSSIVTQPWHVMTELGADGGKNIYTYLYQVLYGNGIWFRGMNYPYGEHIVYTDAQPALSVTLSFFKHYLSIQSALAIMWWMIALSYVAAIVYCYKILRHFGVTHLVAMIFAGLILLLNPQMLRLSGHYALSYTCFIPMLFYWTLKYHTGSSLKYPLYMLIAGVIASFMHPYYAAVALVWVGCYSLWYIILQRGTFLKRIRHVLPVLLSIGGVFVIFGLVMRLTDPITDRPVVPFGMLVNCTTYHNIFTSAYSPIWVKAMNHKFIASTSDGGEGYSYPGIVALLCLGLTAFLWAVSRVRKLMGSTTLPANGFQPVWLFAAFTALIFSMGIPFIWHMEWLLDYASFLRQFRSLGRFSWLFYYVITIYAAVCIYGWYAQMRQKDKPLFASLILILPIVLWAYEASGYVKRTHTAVATGIENYNTFISKNDVTWPQFLAEHHHKAEEFQASLVIPFFEVGSEKLWVTHNDFICAWGIAMGIKAGMQLHLPMIDADLSRTSWRQAFDQVKIAGGPYTKKPMLDGLKDERPFLLLLIDFEAIDPDQSYLIESSDYLGHYLHCGVYACYPSRIRANDRKYEDTVQVIYSHMKARDTCVHNTGPWYVDHLDKSNIRYSLFGSKAVLADSVLSKTIASFPLKPVADQQLYEFSCWFLVPQYDYSSPYCIVTLLDSSSHTIAEYYAHCKESLDNHNGWIRDNVFFAVPAACRSVRCRLMNIPSWSYIAMDELLVRPADALILSKTNELIIENNH